MTYTSIMGKSLAKTLYVSEIRPHLRIFISRSVYDTGPFFVVLNEEIVISERSRRFRSPQQNGRWIALDDFITAETFDQAMMIVGEITEDYDAWRMRQIL